MFNGWKAWAGPPKQIVIDAARTNIGSALADPTELEGTQLCPIAGEGQWQNGKTEVHGGWWARICTKVLASVQPRDKTEWLECVDHTNAAKNEMIQVYGMTPCQHVFGRNPTTVS